jgi:hypothetical protein
MKRAHKLAKLLRRYSARQLAPRPPSGPIAWKNSGLHSIGSVGEPAEAPHTVKETHCLIDYERCNERPVGFGVLFHQTLRP